MPDLLKSLSEHASIIILILAGFSVWSMKRILGKLEKSLEDEKEDREKAVTELKAQIRDLYEKHNKLGGEFNQLLGEHHATHQGGK